MNQTVRGWVVGLMLLPALLVCPWPGWAQNAPESGKGPAGSSLEYLDLEGGEGSLPVWREEESPASVPKGGEPEHESLAPKKEALSPEHEARDRPPGAAAGAEPAGSASGAGLPGGGSEVRQKPAGAAGAGASESVTSAKGREPAREVDSKKILQSDSPEKFLDHHEEIDKDLIRIYRGFYRKP
jgi:hypothetical protein